MWVKCQTVFAPLELKTAITRVHAIISDEDMAPQRQERSLVNYFAKQRANAEAAKKIELKSAESA
jgi:hypothetical protein